MKSEPNELVQLVLDHYEPAKAWGVKAVENWINWAFDHGFLFQCYDKPGGKLVGLTIVRPLSLTRIARDGVNIKDHEFDMDGEVLYVDITISSAGKEAMRAMMTSIMERMHDKSVIVFQRRQTEGKFNVYPLGEFATKLITGKR